MVGFVVGASEGIEAYIVWCTTSDVLGAAMKPTTNALHATTVPLDLQAVLRPPMDAAAMFHVTRRGCRIILQNCTLGFTRGNAVAEKSRPMSRVFDVLTSGPYFTTLRSCRGWRFTFCQRCSTRRSRPHRCAAGGKIALTAARWVDGLKVRCWQQGAVMAARCAAGGKIGLTAARWVNGGKVRCWRQGALLAARCAAGGKIALTAARWVNGLKVRCWQQGAVMAARCAAGGKIALTARFGAFSRMAFLLT